VSVIAGIVLYAIAIPVLLNVAAKHGAFR